MKGRNKLPAQTLEEMKLEAAAGGAAPMMAHPPGTCLRIDGPPPWWWPIGMAWPPSQNPPVMG